MRTAVLLACALVCAAPHPAQAASSALPIPVQAFDIAALLPPPPAAASPAEKLELDELRRVQATRSADDVARARADGEHKNVTIFAGAMGPGFDLGSLPETRALFDTVRAEEKAVVAVAKKHFLRRRPWIADPTIASCERGSEPLSSYPSGHTTMAFSMGGILARLAPGKAAAIMARAADYGHSRVVCEQHYPADVVAGQALGSVIADRLAHDPSFAAAMARAQAELQAHHLG